MVKKVQDENSNSQNDNLFVSKISCRGTAGNSFTLELSSGSLFCISGDFLLSHKLKKGLPISPEFLALVKREDEENRCRVAALSYVARREHSGFELKQKLTKKGFAQATVETVICKLVDLNIVNDYRYALKRISSRLSAKPQGEAALVGDLLKQGVPINVAKAAVKEELTASDFDNALLKAYEKLKKNSNKSREQIVAALMRKGFSYGQISKTISELDGFNVEE